MPHAFPNPQSAFPCSIFILHDTLSLVPYVLSLSPLTPCSMPYAPCLLHHGHLLITRPQRDYADPIGQLAIMIDSNRDLAAAGA